jgi:hypothetical protein
MSRQVHEAGLSSGHGKPVELKEPFPPKRHDFLTEMVTDRL